MGEEFVRTRRVLGVDAMEILKNARVAVFGVGGVGGYVVEALVRSGVGAIDVIDNDTVCESNLNRQIIATRSTIGMDKVSVIKNRIMNINPECVVTAHKCFYLPENSDTFDFSQYDYVVDAIDTVAGKISLAMECKKTGTPIISSMGTGNKVNPMMLEVTDLSQTSVCPLARVMRTELRKRGITELKVIYSKEVPIKPLEEVAEEAGNQGSQGTSGGQSKRRSTPGSTAFVPSVAGLIIASEVVKDLTGIRN